MTVSTHVRCVCGKISFTKSEAKQVVKRSKSKQKNERREDDYYKSTVLTGVHKCTRSGKTVWHTTSRIEWGK